MSQERTRFPIQPDERRRSARSSEDIAAVPDESARDDEAVLDQRASAERNPQDKPSVPPHRRHERDQDPGADRPDPDAD